MAVNLQESVDRLHEDDSNDRKGEVNDAGEDLIVEDALIFGLYLVEESAEGSKCEDDE